MPGNRIQPRPVTSGARRRFTFVDPLRFALRGQLVLKDGFAGFLRARLPGAIPNLAEPAAFCAGPVRRVKENKRGSSSSNARPHPGSSSPGAHDREAMLRVQQVRSAAPDLEVRALDQIPRFQNSSGVDRSDHDVDGVLLEAFELSELGDRQEFSIDKERVEALPSSAQRATSV